MENYYERLVKNIGKLKRNVQNMTAQQMEQYKRPLQKLRREISADATSAMHDFLFGGIRILSADREGLKDFTKKAEEIMQADGKDAAKEASRVLFSTYEIDKFLEALLPLHYRICYEAYGPVWLACCKPTGDPEHPYINGIIQMVWEKKSGVWVDRERTSFTLMLPPTRELLERQYEEEKRSMT